MEQLSDKTALLEFLATDPLLHVYPVCALLSALPAGASTP